MLANQASICPLQLINNSIQTDHKGSFCSLLRSSTQPHVLTCPLPLLLTVFHSADIPTGNNCLSFSGLQQGPSSFCASRHCFPPPHSIFSGLSVPCIGAVSALCQWDNGPFSPAWLCDGTVRMGTVETLIGEGYHSSH